MPESEKPPTPDPDQSHIIQAVLQDIKDRGPIFLAVMEALRQEISRGCPLAPRNMPPGQHSLLAKYLEDGVSR